MRGRLERHQRAGKPDEVRMHFDSWTLPAGKVVEHVTIFPHPCETCVGGDHTHVEVNDVRTPVEIVGEVVLPDALKFAVDRYLTEKFAVDALTGELAHVRDSVVP